MVRFALITCILALVACTSPSPSVMGGEVKDLEIEGSRFRIFVDPARQNVEAHRISFEPLPGRVAVLTAAYSAIVSATGCDIIDGSMRGDQAIVTASIRCPPQN